MEELHNKFLLCLSTGAVILSLLLMLVGVILLEMNAPFMFVALLFSPFVNFCFFVLSYPVGKFILNKK